ncbi:MAG: hypothetical protein WBR13_02625 [Allosphingosinicella sp.]
MLISLEAKCAERDTLQDWLKALETKGASPQSLSIVRGQLERVRHEIARLKGLDAVGFSSRASTAR